MIVSVGALTDKEQQAASLRNEIEARFQKLSLKTPRRVLYLIWRQPWMAAGKGTFIDSMLSKIGLVNVVEEARYPTLSDAQLQQMQPELNLAVSGVKTRERCCIRELTSWKRDLSFRLRFITIDSKYLS